MTTSNPTPDLVCPVCGTVNPVTRQFCRRCAADLRAPVGDPRGPAAATPAAVPLRPILIGVGAAVVVLVALMGLLFALGDSPAASPTPAPTPSAEVSDAPTLAPTLVPTSLPTQAPTIAPTPTPAATAPPPSVGTGSPVVDTLRGPGRASCTGTNGTGTPGYIHLEWTASNTTGVRLSIDPPAPNDAYDYGYADYAADDEADVPFTCDPPNSDANGEYHLYVVTTLHDNGRFAWRFIRVYIRD